MRDFDLMSYHILFGSLEGLILMYTPGGPPQLVYIQSENELFRIFGSFNIYDSSSTVQFKAVAVEFVITSPPPLRWLFPQN